MMNTLLGVGIGYLVFKWAESEPINTPNGEENAPDPQDPAPPQRSGVWTLESVSSVKQDSDSQLYYGCGTYAWDGGRTGTYRYIVVQSSQADPAKLEEWSELMGSDGSFAYSFAMKSDCVKMVDELTKTPAPEDKPPEKAPEPEEKPPTPPSPLPPVAPDFGNMGGFTRRAGGIY